MEHSSELVSELFLCLNLIKFKFKFKFKFKIDYKHNFNAQQKVSSIYIARDWRVGGATPRGSVRQARQLRELATGWLTANPQKRPLRSANPHP
ncbi:hypothetical protein CSV75_04940 [Sporosarcina sp. P18a]|nr:hypothetical protein CSV75_04940 [Sporosarcina sp. P18a]